MGENDEPSEGMLEFIRVLLSQSIGDERAKNLPDDEIAWIAPLVDREIFKLGETEESAIILYYGLYGRKPLSLEEVGKKVLAENPLTCDQVKQMVEYATKALSTAIKRFNNREHNLLWLLSGKKGATAVLGDKDHTSLPALYTLQNVIDDLKIVQFKCNVQSFIFEELEKSLDKEIQGSKEQA